MEIKRYTKDYLLTFSIITGDKRRDSLIIWAKWIGIGFAIIIPVRYAILILKGDESMIHIFFVCLEFIVIAIFIIIMFKISKYKSNGKLIMGGDTLAIKSNGILETYEVDKIQNLKTNDNRGAYNILLEFDYENKNYKYNKTRFTLSNTIKLYIFWRM